MILSNINKYTYISKLSDFLKILKKSRVLKKFNKSFYLHVKKRLGNTKLNFLNRRKTLPKNVIRYIINIISFRYNTVVSVTDTSGKVIVTVSEGLIKLSKESKQAKPIHVVKLLKNLLVNATFIKNKAVSIKFKNVKRHQEAFFINCLKSKVFIKSIESNKLIPHNGCRPKKIRKIKLRTKRLILK